MKNNHQTNDWKTLHKKMENVLGNDFLDEMNKIVPRRVPPVDMYQMDHQIVVVAEIPGYQEQYHPLSIKLVGYKLIIEGDIPYRNPVIVEDLILNECFSGHFKREIILPHDCKTKDITAHYKHGILHIYINKEVEETFVPVTYSENE